MLEDAGTDALPWDACPATPLPRDTGPGALQGDPGPASNPGQYLKTRLTVMLTTSPVPLHPSTCLVDEVPLSPAPIQTTCVGSS